MIKNMVEYLGHWYDSHDLRLDLVSWKAVIVLDQDVHLQVCLEVICKGGAKKLKNELAAKGLEPIRFKAGTHISKTTERIQRSGEDVYRFYLSPDRNIQRIILL